MRATATAFAVAGLVALGGCSVEVGDVEKIPEYTAVEGAGVSLEVVDGMVLSDVEGYDAFWQNHDGSTLVSAGIVTDIDAESFVDERLDVLGGSVDDITTEDAGDGDVWFDATGVDDSHYRGMIAVRDGVGVMVSSGKGGVGDKVLQHMVDSVTVSGEADGDESAAQDDEAAADDAAEDDVAQDDVADDESATDGPATTTVWTEGDEVSVDVLEGMEQVPSDAYTGLWKSPEGQQPEVTVSVTADVDPATYLQDQASVAAESLTDPVELSETEDRYAFTYTAGGEEYTAVVGVNGTVGVIASAGPGVDEQVLQDIVDSAW